MQVFRLVVSTFKDQAKFLDAHLNVLKHGEGTAEENTDTLSSIDECKR